MLCDERLLGNPVIGGHGFSERLLRATHRKKRKFVACVRVLGPTAGGSQFGRNAKWEEHSAASVAGVVPFPFFAADGAETVFGTSLTGLPSNNRTVHTCKCASAHIDRARQVAKHSEARTQTCKYVEPRVCTHVCTHSRADVYAHVDTPVYANLRLGWQAVQQGAVHERADRELEGRSLSCRVFAGVETCV